MIPKKIHYCWFGGKPLNKLGRKCLKSWKKFFPDYEIIEWNESNFDLKCCKYVEEAYNSKKYAFVSDYVRFKVLYEQGGIYFDTDVEVIKPFDDILSRGNFIGCENTDANKMAVAAGLGLGSCSGTEFFKEVLDSYENSSFLNDDGTMNLYTVVERVTDMLYGRGLRNSLEIQQIEGLTVYPSEYFCPINMKSGKLEKTVNTHSIHRFSASWVNGKDRMRGKIYRFIFRVFGEKTANKIRRKVGRKK